jgi:acetate kinase
MSRLLLAVNAGSSSLKLAVFDIASEQSQALLRGRLETRANPRRLDMIAADGTQLAGPEFRLGRRTGGRSLAGALAWIEARLGAPIAAVAHRIVHGGDLARAAVATDATVRAAEEVAAFAPLHQTAGLAAVYAIRRERPDTPQVLVFDTLFHRGHDPVVDRLGLPRTWEERGLRRYGFHGLSYEHLTARLRELDPSAASGRVVAAHLGSGASLCALLDGRSVDTTMGATPLDGLVMGTRCGSLDPGAVLLLQQMGNLTPAAATDLLYRRAGLLGVSGLSGDMRTLLSSPDPRARAAIDLFVFRIARETAALAATLGGLDAIVFTGGIGENAPQVRAAVCERLAWLGVRLDAARNGRGDARVSAPGSRVAVWTIPADEERVIARHAREVLG